MNLLKSHTCLMKNSPYIFYVLRDFLAYTVFKVSSWWRFGLRHRAVYWAQCHYSVRWCYIQQRPASIEWICAELSVLTVRMHINTLIMIITCLGAPPERLAEEKNWFEESTWVEKPRQWWKWWLAINSTGCHLWITTAFNPSPHS